MATSPLAAGLDTASAIGARIANEAIWEGERCNWVGADVDETNPYGGHYGAAYRALGPDLYGGAAGVAVFLAALGAKTDDKLIRRCALGGIRQALARVESQPDLSGGGLYSGALGTAYAAVQVGAALSSEEVLSRAIPVLKRAVGDSRRNPHFDVVSGKAGELVALLTLAQILGDVELREEAAARGAQLLDSAVRTAAGFSWTDPVFARTHNLCGFAHGAAGAAYALLELFAATGAEDCRQAADQAFEYERSWFDAETGNWADLRHWDELGDRRRPSMVAWCHGAPGIAISRLRAFDALREEGYRREAAIALETTAAAVQRAVRYGPDDFSLCHGLAGNAAVLLLGAEVLDAERTSMTALALDAAGIGIERFAAEDQEWPCGVPTGETPSLLLGLAGIGHFYLRLDDPALRSPLTPGPWPHGRPS